MVGKNAQEKRSAGSASDRPALTHEICAADQPDQTSVTIDHWARASGAGWPAVPTSGSSCCRVRYRDELTGHHITHCGADPSDQIEFAHDSGDTAVLKNHGAPPMRRSESVCAAAWTDIPGPERHGIRSHHVAQLPQVAFVECLDPLEQQHQFVIVGALPRAWLELPLAQSVPRRVPLARGAAARAVRQCVRGLKTRRRAQTRTALS